MKFTDLFEQSIGYTPEGFDKEMNEIKSYVEKVQKFQDDNYNFIVNITIKDVLDNLESFEDRASKFEDLKLKISNKYTYFYRVFDTITSPYDSLFDYPDNVRAFEKILDRLGELDDNIGNISSSYDDLVSSARHLTNLY